jgi:multidrug efflux pump subunit AcrB
LTQGKSLARAALDATDETRMPRLLAMLCILAMFTPALFMTGAARAMFLPLALAVGFSMVGSYFLSSTVVPLLSVWLLRGREDSAGQRKANESAFARFQGVYADLLQQLAPWRMVLVVGYLAGAIAIIVFVGQRLGVEIFPQTDTGQLQMRFRAPAGTDINGSEAVFLKALNLIKKRVGPDNVSISLGLIGIHGANFPINFVHLWNGGPEEGVLQVQIKPGAKIRIEALKEQLRQEFAEQMPGANFSFEPADIVSRVMSLGADTPIEVAVSGQDLATSRAFAEKIKTQLEDVAVLRDVQFGQSLDYPTVDVKVDRERAGIIGPDMKEVSKALVPATWSSRFVNLNFWADPNSGVAYQVQVQIPQKLMTSLEDVGNLPVLQHNPKDPEKKVKDVTLRNIAQITEGTAMGEYERYNMQRLIKVRANIFGDDLAGAARQVHRAIAELGPPPTGVTVAVRGQVVPMQEMLDGLWRGLALAVVAIFLLLTANFQSLKMSFVVVSTVPAVLAGVVMALWLTDTTLNIQSFMGAIMGVGVAVANAILLVTFAERNRLGGAAAVDAGMEGARTRLRPILMTSAAMIAGMLPMALSLGEASGQAAPLGRAVVGGLSAATIATLFVLPSIFAVVQGGSHRRAASLDPNDPQSNHYQAVV